MVRLYTNGEGPGSYEEIVDHVESVLRENFIVKNDAVQDPYDRRARNIVMSVLNRLGIDIFPSNPE